MEADTHDLGWGVISFRNLSKWSKNHIGEMLVGLVLVTALNGCAPSIEVAEGMVAQTQAPSDDPLNEVAASPTVTSTADPGDWVLMPVIPEVSERAREIYQQGIIGGNNPHAFSKVGDCQNVPSMFMASLDNPENYSLGEEYDHLQVTIDWFAGSFSRESQAVRKGFNAASIVSPFWADPEACLSGETPLECEYRIHRPIIAIISLERWWGKGAESYEKYLREIIELTIENGVVPILSTKADNIEGDHSINITIYRLAKEYDIPLWNFWLAVQPLPAHGLERDGFHLTYARTFFDDPERMKAAWPWRNLTALQALDEVWSKISAPREVP